MQRKFAALAAAAVTAAGLSAIATPAFAAGPSQSGNWSNSFTVQSTLTLSLSATSTTITPNLGGTAYTNAPGTFANAAQTATVGTNDGAGYSLTEAVSSAFSNGSKTVPDTSVSAWVTSTKAYTAYDATGDGITIGAVSGPSGNMTSHIPTNDGAPYSDSDGNDDFPAGTALTLPSSLPSGSYSATFTFTALGN